MSTTRQARRAAVDPLQLERARVLDHEAARRKAVRGRADEDLSGTRSLLEPRREIDGLTRRECRFRPVNDDLAGLDADAGFQLHLGHRLVHRERCASGALRIVLVRLRNAECSHDGVSCELLHDAAVLRDAVRDHVEELRSHGAGRPPDPCR